MQDIATEIGFSETAFIKQITGNILIALDFLLLKKKYHYADTQHWLLQRSFLILQVLTPSLL
jgi:hypothetical protein